MAHDNDNDHNNIHIFIEPQSHNFGLLRGYGGSMKWVAYEEIKQK